MKTVADLCFWTKQKQNPNFDPTAWGLFWKGGFVKTENLTLTDILASNITCLVIEIQNINQLRQLEDYVLQDFKIWSGKRDLFVTCFEPKLMAEALRLGWQGGLSVSSEMDLFQWHMNRQRMGKFVFVESHLASPTLVETAKALGIELWLRQDNKKWHRLKQHSFYGAQGTILL